MAKVIKKESDIIADKENKYYSYILFFIFCVIVCLFSTTKISVDNDVFWHLTTGRYIVQNFSIPSTEIFGFATSGRNWVPFEWGWEVLNYLAFSLGGFVALSIFRTVIILCIFYVLYLIIKKLKINIYFALLFSFVLLLGILTRLNIRPQIVTYLFSILLLYFLINHKLSEKANKKIVYILPIIYMLWANLHMGVILGMIIFGIFVFSEIVNFFFINARKTADDKEKLKILLISFAVSILALLINPFFYHVYTYTLSYTKIDMLDQINEWKSPLKEETLSYYNGKIYVFFLITGLITLYYSFKKKDFFPATLFIIMGVYSIQAVRFMADFMLVVFVFWLLAFDFILNKSKIYKIFNHYIFNIVLAVFLIFIAITSYNNYFYKNILGNYFRETGFGINENFFPKSMFDFIRSEGIEKIGQRPFNNLKIGSYFIWEFPGSKNFIDSRDLYDDLYFDYKSIDFKKQGFEALMDKYGFDYVIYNTPYLTVNASEIQRNIISYLSAQNTKWKLVYWDDKSFLFVKNEAKFEKIISKYEYKYVSPYNYLFAKDFINDKFVNDKETFVNELKRKLNDEPNGVFINTMMKTFKR